VREALELQQHAAVHAMIDISDGLAADVNHLCSESGCGAVLLACNIPCAEAAQRLDDGRTPLQHALGDGEDFELAFAVAAEDGARLLATQPIAGIRLAHIGHCTAAPGMLLEADGERRPLAAVGFTHEF
jgi:thiamine-monophosphate kinase